MVPKSSVWKHSTSPQVTRLLDRIRGATIKLNNILFLYVNVFKWQTEITLSNQDTIHLNFKKQNRYDQ